MASRRSHTVAATLVTAVALGALVLPEVLRDERGAESPAPPALAPVRSATSIEPSVPGAKLADDAAAKARPAAGKDAREDGSAPVGTDAAADAARLAHVPGTLSSRTARPGGPGASSLYPGGDDWRTKIPPGLKAGVLSPEEVKAAQLERSADIAEKRGTIVGRIDHVNATEIAGWAYAWDDPGTPVSVDVFTDGTLLTTTTASASRPSFAPQDPSNPINFRAFSVPTPAALQDGDKHWVTAQAYKQGSDSKRQLDNSPCAFGGSPGPSGQLVWVSANMAFGWAQDPSAPGAPVTVSILGDGTLLGKVTTLGAGKNATFLQQALALSPQQKTAVMLDGVSGPADPNLQGAINAKLQALVQASRYVNTMPLAQAAATAGLAYDELDFYAPAATAGGSAVALTGKEVAAVKFSLPADPAQAFLFTPTAPITASWLQARVTSVDGTVDRELQRSPMQIGAGNNALPYGAVVFVSPVQISGWAVDPDVAPAPISVDVTIDGTYFGRIPANQNFAALPNGGTVKEPNHAFCFTPPNQYLDGKTHTIQFFAVNQPDGINPEIQGSPAIFVGQRNATPYGFLDVANAQTAGGWAYDPDANAAPINVQIWIDNVLFTTTQANTNRPDLVPIVAAEPTHGFSVAMPPSLGDGKVHTIRAFAVNFPDGPNQELSGSPKELNAQTPFIGISVADQGANLSIAYVVSGSSAAQAGILGGDVIHSYDGATQKVDYAAFAAWVQTLEVGEKVVFTLYRDPSLQPPAPAAPPPDPSAPPLGPGERIVVVSVGSR
jgi:hypothetical protein